MLAQPPPTMKVLRFVSFAVLALGLSLHAAVPFPQTGSDLKADPAARFGTLTNGLRYVILPNHEPKDRASLRLLVETGSLFEQNDQRGLAHFLEHMAFNGSTHYPPGTLVEFFQRMGMSFGGDTNAYTSFDRTVYMLELPETKEKTLVEGLKVFADYAEGLLLSEKEIDRERGVILSEKRTRDSVGYRTWVAEFEFILNGTLFPKRIPIGTQEVIEKASRERFVEFYNAWYQPERMAVVIVGDIDPAAVEKQVAAILGGIKPRAAAQPLPDYGRVADLRGVRVNLHSEPEAPATTVGIAVVLPYADKPDTAAQRLEKLPRNLAIAMLERRLSILAKKENSSFTSGRTNADEAFDFFREASIELTCKPAQWQAALTTADHELRRALEHGFQAAELKEAVANLTNSLEQAVKTAPTRRSPALADELATSLADKEVFTPPADDLALFAPALAKVTVEDCVQALRAAWNAPHRYVTVSGNAEIGKAAPVAAKTAAPAPATPVSDSAEAVILAVYEAAHAVAVRPPEAMVDAAWAYTDFGPAGTVAKREHIADLDLTLITFANGVRLNLKKTDFEANRIRSSIRIGTGQLTEPKDLPGLAFFTSNTFSSGGLGKHSLDDLQRLLAGKTVGLGFRVGTDALTFGATTNRDDLLLQLQLISAYITDPGYRAEALRQARKNMEQLYTGIAHRPEGPLQTEVPRLLANGDPRFGLPPKEAALARTLEESKAWLSPQLAKGPIEIALVGDIDLEATIAAVGKTLGALPPRAPRPALTAERQVSFPAQPFTKDYSVTTEIPKGIVALYWPTADTDNIQRTRRLNMLAEVFSDRLRLKVRQELGGAYSPGAGNIPSDTYTGYGYMMANVTVDPAKAGQIADVIVQISNDLYQTGVTDDELERAKKPVLTSLRESARTNPYWLGSVLARAQEKPQALDWCRSRYADNEAITKAEVDALAKTYLVPGHVFRAIVLPAKKNK